MLFRRFSFSAILLLTIAFLPDDASAQFEDFKDAIPIVGGIAERLKEQKEKKENEKKERVSFVEEVVDRFYDLSETTEVPAELENEAIRLEEDLVDCVDASVKDCDGKRLRLSARKFERKLARLEEQYQDELEKQRAEERRVAEQRRAEEESRRAEERRVAEQRRAEEESRRAEERRVVEENRVAEEKEANAAARRDLVSKLEQMEAFEERSIFGSEPNALADKTGGMSLSQLELSYASYIGMQQYEDGSNEMQRGASRVTRKKYLCDLVYADFAESVGVVKDMGANQEGKGTLSIMIAEDVVLQTASLEMTDALYSTSTLIDPTSSLGDQAMELSVGDLVRFDGNLISSSKGFSNDSGDDCVVENSVSLSGSMKAPEYLFKFTSIEKIQ